MLPKYVWDNIAQENYLRNVGDRDTFAEKPAVSNMSGSLVLTGYYITEQSWLFLFNVGSGIHLRLAGQQWTRVDFDWNMETKFITTIFLSSFLQPDWLAAAPTAQQKFDKVSWEIVEIPPTSQVSLKLITTRLRKTGNKIKSFCGKHSGT